jgi:RecA-family ATPase
VHAWVRIDAKNREEYHARREKVWASLPGFQIDKANKNPSRFSRCPGGLRNNHVQRLIAVNVGAASFADWEAQYEDARDIDFLTPYCGEDEVDPPQIIEGILFRGAKMVIAGPSKARKTWNLTDLALSVAYGQPWCGYQTQRTTVIYVNLEIARFSYRKRLRMLCTARGFNMTATAASSTVSLGWNTHASSFFFSCSGCVFTKNTVTTQPRGVWRILPCTITLGSVSGRGVS